MFESLKSKREREEQQQRIAAAEQQLDVDRKAVGERNTINGKADAKLIGANALEIREGEIVGLGRQLEGRIATETGTITDFERSAVEWRKGIEVEIANAEHEIIVSRDTSHQLETGRRLSAWREVLKLSKLHFGDRQIEIDRHRDSLKRDQAELTKAERDLKDIQRQIERATA